MNYFNFSNDTFVGQYVNSYDDVISTPCPFNGQPVICADLNSMMLYSKKNVNGIPVIQPYKLTPLYQEATKPKTTENDTLSMILNRLDKLEGLYESKQHNDEHVNGAIKE